MMYNVCVYWGQWLGQTEFLVNQKLGLTSRQEAREGRIAKFETFQMEPCG